MNATEQLDSRNEQRLVYTVEEAGALLGLSRGSAFKAARSGELPTVRFGKRIAVPKVALEQKLREAGRT
jgi:excisionase family DNA binding protein